MSSVQDLSNICQQLLATSNEAINNLNNAIQNHSSVDLPMSEKLQEYQLALAQLNSLYIKSEFFLSQMEKKKSVDDQAVQSLVTQVAQVTDHIETEADVTVSSSDEEDYQLKPIRIVSRHSRDLCIDISLEDRVRLANIRTPGSEDEFEDEDYEDMDMKDTQFNSPTSQGASMYISTPTKVNRSLSLPGSPHSKKVLRNAKSHDTGLGKYINYESEDEDIKETQMGSPEALAFLPTFQPMKRSTSCDSIFSMKKPEPPVRTQSIPWMKIIKNNAPQVGPSLTANVTVRPTVQATTQSVLSSFVEAKPSTSYFSLAERVRPPSSHWSIFDYITPEDVVTKETGKRLPVTKAPVTPHRKSHTKAQASLTIGPHGTRFTSLTTSPRDSKVLHTRISLDALQDALNNNI